MHRPHTLGLRVRLPRKCFFSGNPDVRIPLDLSGLLRSEVSIIAALRTGYFVDPPASRGWTTSTRRTPASRTSGRSSSTQSVDIDVFDIADIVGDLLEDAMDAAVDTLLGFLPGWARDLVKAILGSFIDVIRDILDLPTTWRVAPGPAGGSFGLLNVIVTAVLDYLLAKPVFEFEDPFPILGPEGGLIPVKIRSPTSRSSHRRRDGRRSQRRSLGAQP